MPRTVQHAGRPEGASPGAACGVGAGMGVKAGVTAATGAWTVTGTEIVTGSLCSSVGMPGYSVRSTRNSCVIHSSPSWRVLTNAELLAQHLAPLGERGPRIGSRRSSRSRRSLSSRRRGSTSLMSRPVVPVRWQRRSMRRHRSARTRWSLDCLRRSLAAVPILRSDEAHEVATSDSFLEPVSRSRSTTIPRGRSATWRPRFCGSRSGRSLMGWN